jgi:hypothetical protein
MRMDLVQPQPSSNAVRKCEHIGHQLLCSCLRFDNLAHPLRKTHGPLRGNPRLTDSYSNPASEMAGWKHR